MTAPSSRSEISLFRSCFRIQEDFRRFLQASFLQDLGEFRITASRFQGGGLVEDCGVVVHVGCSAVFRYGRFEIVIVNRDVRFTG